MPNPFVLLAIVVLLIGGLVRAVWELAKLAWAHIFNENHGKP